MKIINTKMNANETKIAQEKKLACIAILSKYILENHSNHNSKLVFQVDCSGCWCK